MALAVSALKQQIEKAKESLKSVDDNIKKVTGRDPNEARPLPDRGRGRGGSNLGRRHYEDPKEIKEEEPAAKRTGGIFRRVGSAPSGDQGRRVLISRRHSQKQQQESENEDDEDDVVKPKVQSSVISTVKSVTKSEVISAQNVDEKGKARNRRMFGMLLGTLARFQSDESKADHFAKQEQRRTEIEQRLEEASAEERKKAAAERRGLYTERRSQQRKILLLEQKVALAGEVWNILLSAFIGIE
ncbi:unnamed protein product [Clavelina lepadiformis]|uniref:Pinin n=1 Tax=Clavelina lepadiformis TaxID=159417 RepID=A0ABP0GU21_CLALP